MIDQLKNHENARAFSGHRKPLIFSCKRYIKIIVKPNSPENKIISYDKEKDAYKVNIKAKPVKNEANKEIIKFFSKLLKKKVKIVKGLKSKKKILNASF